MKVFSIKLISFYYVMASLNTQPTVGIASITMLDITSHLEIENLRFVLDYLKKGL